MTMFGAGPGVGPAGMASPMFKLEYPQSIGIFATYADAQRAVDALAEQDFPVANLAIVGTDLKLVERVTGRKTWATVLQQGFTSGLSTALMIALILFFLDPARDFIGLFLEALLIGIVIGVGFAALGHLLSRSGGARRDFTSVTQTIPNKFEILCEHRVATQARDLLARTPAGRAAAWNAAAAQPYPPQGLPPQVVPQGYPPAQPPVAGPQAPASQPYPPQQMYPSQVGAPQQGSQTGVPGQAQVPVDGGQAPDGSDPAGQPRGGATAAPQTPPWPQNSSWTHGQN